MVQLRGLRALGLLQQQDEVQAHLELVTLAVQDGEDA
jgi:hypothetical protein